METFETAATGVVLTFLWHKLMQAILLLLLDDSFMYAFVHGYDEVCSDGIRQCGFPRFFFHGTDYPEKCVDGVPFTLLPEMRLWPAQVRSQYTPSSPTDQP